MTCPRCGNEWDVSKSPCSRCGLLVRIPARNQTRSQQQSDGRALEKQQQSRSASFEAPSMPSSSMNLSGQAPSGQSGSRPSNPSWPPMAGPNSGASGNASQPSSRLNSSSPSYPPTTRERNGAGGLPGSSSPNFSPKSASPFKSQPEGSLTDQAAQRGIPSRPGAASPTSRSMEPLVSDIPRQQVPLRPSRLVTEIQPGGDVQSKFTSSPTQDSWNNAPTASPSTLNRDTSGLLGELPVLVPGVVLRSGRYRLREMQERQEWTPGVTEAAWIAQDAQRAGAQVVICEVVVPESSSMMAQSLLRTATMTLTSVGRHPHIPTLWDAFSEQGRNFFVFEPIEGETLLSRMRRAAGRVLSEHDVIECCLQMTEVLELLSQQAPPLVHGLIRPEHIIMGHSDAQCVLTNFSVVLAGGGNQLIAGADQAISPYMAPEIARGVIDVRTDLYALMATAYHVATGSLPTADNNGNVVPASRVNPQISPQLNAILARGLRPIAGQRYQRPSELRQELLAMYSAGSLPSGRSAGFAGAGDAGLDSLPPLSRGMMDMPPQPRSVRDMPGQSRPVIDMPLPMPVQPAYQQQPRVVSAALQPQFSASPDPVAQMLPNMLSRGIGGEEDEERRLLLPHPDELAPVEERNDFGLAIVWLCAILVGLLIVIAASRGLI